MFRGSGTLNSRVRDSDIMNQLYSKHNGSGSLEDKIIVPGEFRKGIFYNRFFKSNPGLILDSGFYMDKLSHVLVPIYAHVEFDNKSQKVKVMAEERVVLGKCLTEELIRMYDDDKFEFEKYVLELINREKLSFIYSSFSNGSEAVNREIFPYVKSVQASPLWVSPRRSAALEEQIKNGGLKSMSRAAAEPLGIPAFSPA